MNDASQQWKEKWIQLDFLQKVKFKEAENEDCFIGHYQNQRITLKLMSLLSWTRKATLASTMVVELRKRINKNLSLQHSIFQKSKMIILRIIGL